MATAEAPIKGPRRRPLHRRVLRPFEDFFASEASGGILLLIATTFALIWANSPWSDTYHQFWSSREMAGIHHPSLHFVVNDCLMVVFFFVVGLEIKRELLVGELAQPRRAALPVIAAAGGALLPALIYLALNHAPAVRAGWGIPIATDIAFAVGVVAIFSNSVPVSARVFLTALAIVDDLIAVLVIALFYTSGISPLNLALAVACLGVLIGCNLAGMRRVPLYLALGLVLWYFTLRSGVHSTIAGVLLASVIPARGDRALLPALEERLHPWVTYGIMPVFAFANAGLSFGHGILSGIGQGVVIGIWVGLLIGKPVGITLAALLATRAGWAVMPVGVHFRRFHAVTWLGGIGFTMSLFIAGLAFKDFHSLELAKLGIFGGSLSAGLIGSALLACLSRTGKPMRDAIE